MLNYVKFELKKKLCFNQIKEYIIFYSRYYKKIELFERIMVVKKA